MLKEIIDSVVYHIVHPQELIMKIVVCTPRLWSDKVYLKQFYRYYMGKDLNLENPSTFNEKMQWLKLYNRKPEYTIMVDKVKVKEYVASFLGEEYIIPTLGVWDDPDKINFNSLPEQFVLKCNHNSGTGMYICKDKSKMDLEAVKAELRKGLKENYFIRNREWPYKNVPRRILAEQYLDPDPAINDLRDYKFFCFNGKVRFYKIDFDRHVNHHANYFSPMGKLLPFGEKDLPPVPEKVLDIPASIPKMIMLAEKIAKGHPFMRVDFYDYYGKIYFGEITFFPASGIGKYTSAEWDEHLGSLIDLPNIK